MPKVNKLTTPEKDAIKNKSPLNMPTNPTKSGWSDGQIKQRLSQFVTDEQDSVLAILDEKLEEVDDAFTETDGDVTAVEARVTTAEGDINVLEGKVSTLEGQNLNTRLTAAEGDIDQLETDVLALDNTKADITYVDAHKNNTSNPHSVTKAQVGLGNADNTSDLNKPISTATQSALNLKADLVDGKVPQNQLPSYVDDILDVYVRVGATEGASNWLSLTNGGAALTPEAGKIYVIISAGNFEGKTYRWSGSAYSPVGDIALGTTAATAFPGDRGLTIENALPNKANLVNGKIPTSEIPNYFDDVFPLQEVRIFLGNETIPTCLVNQRLYMLKYDSTSPFQVHLYVASQIGETFVKDTNYPNGAPKDAFYVDYRTDIGNGETTEGRIYKLYGTGSALNIKLLNQEKLYFDIQSETIFENAGSLPAHDRNDISYLLVKHNPYSGVYYLYKSTGASGSGWAIDYTYFPLCANTTVAGDAPKNAIYLSYNNANNLFKLKPGAAWGLDRINPEVGVSYVDMGTLTTTGPHTITFTATNPAKAVNFVNVKLDSGSFDATIIIPSSLYDKKVIFTFKNIQPASSGRTTITIKTAHASARLYKVHVNAGDTLQYEYLPNNQIITSPINIDYGNVVFPELQFVRSQYLVSTTPLHPSFINLISQPSSSKIRVQLWLYKPTFKEEPSFYQNQYAKRSDFWAHPADNCIGNSVTLPGQSLLNFAGGGAPAHLLDLHTRPIKAGWGVGSYNYRKSIASFIGNTWDLTYDVNGFAATNMPYGGFVRTEFEITADNIVGGLGPQSRLQINMAPFMGSYASNTAWCESQVATTHHIYALPFYATPYLPMNNGGSVPKGIDIPIAVHIKRVRFAYNTLVSDGTGLARGRMTNGSKTNRMAGLFQKVSSVLTPESLRKTNVVFKFVYTLNGEILKFAPNFTGSITINNSAQPATAQDGTSPNRYYLLDFKFSFKNSRYDTRLVKQE